MNHGLIQHNIYKVELEQFIWPKIFTTIVSFKVEQIRCAFCTDFFVLCDQATCQADLIDGWQNVKFDRQ